MSRFSIARSAGSARRKGWWFAGLGALLLCGLLVAPALAYVPSSSLIDAIYYKNLVTYVNSFSIWTRYFASELPGPDGIPGPDGTPDGQGAFLFFRGEVTSIPPGGGAPGGGLGGGGGHGAIYAHVLPNNQGVDARTVYGNMLTAWGNAGYETGYGYPVNDEHAATSDELLLGCRPGDSAQMFRQKTPDRIWIACLQPGSITALWRLVR